MALVVPGPLSRTCEGRGLRPGRPVAALPTIIGTAGRQLYRRFAFCCTGPARPSLRLVHVAAGQAPAVVTVLVSPRVYTGGLRRCRTCSWTWRRNFQGAIERAQGAGEVAGNVDPVHTARALLGLYLGLAVLVRSDAKEPVLRAVVQQARSLLPAPS